MIVLHADQIRQADAYTIEHEPIRSIDLMERACRAFLRTFPTKSYIGRSIHVLCGPGNNGGDGLAIARMLDNNGFEVTAYRLVSSSGRYSPDNETNWQRLRKTGVRAVEFSSLDKLGEIEQQALIIDSLFGSGLNKPLSGLAAALVDHINTLDLPIYSVDIPSGLFCDSPSEGSIVQADRTISFQYPKLCFLLPGSGRFAGRWQTVDIGLDKHAIPKEACDLFYSDASMISALHQKRKKFSHKGTYGHGLLIAGSRGKAGAALLSGKACLRAGAGLLTIHAPQDIITILQTALPEAMCSLDMGSSFIESLPELEPFAAIGIGPGLDTQPKTVEVLRRLLTSWTKPIVLDADALNILSQHKELLGLLGPNCLLTPHPGEFKRLVGDWANDFERLDLQRSFSKDHQVTVILKGAHTSISLPDGRVYFNSTGNPGMATAGSGDTLTGITLALLAQGYSMKDAAVYGTYLHGLAGDLAAEVQSIPGLIASDIIACLGRAFAQIHPQK